MRPRMAVHRGRLR